jgi:hypothetical protein
VYDDFDETYSSTIGTKVTKREVSIANPNNGQIWMFTCSFGILWVSSAL